jgi:hypothetical protein
MKPNGAKPTIGFFKAALTFFADRGGISRRLWNGLVLNIEDSSDPSHHVILDDQDRRAFRAAAHRLQRSIWAVRRSFGRNRRPSKVAQLTAEMYRPILSSVREPGSAGPACLPQRPREDSDQASSSTNIACDDDVAVPCRDDRRPDRQPALAVLGKPQQKLEHRIVLIERGGTERIERCMGIEAEFVCRHAGKLIVGVAIP